MDVNNQGFPRKCVCVSEVLLKILNFESNEGCWVCRQDEGEDPIVKE